MLTYSEEAKKKKKWSGKVETKWHPPEGFFKQSPAKIASELKKNSKNRQQATGRLVFYINRAGKNLSAEDKKRLEDAKTLLEAMYDKEEKEAKKKVSNEGHHEHAMRRGEFIGVYKNFIRKTGMDPKDCIVGAGGACLMFGVRQETFDMDMSIPEEDFKKFLNSGKYPVHIFDEGGPHEVTVVEWSNVIDLHATVGQPPTIMIDGVCCWTPEYTLEFKKKMNRPKDQADIKGLESYIKRHKPSMESLPSLKW